MKSSSSRALAERAPSIDAVASDLAKRSAKRLALPIGDWTIDISTSSEQYLSAISEYFRIDFDGAARHRKTERKIRFVVEEITKAEFEGFSLPQHFQELFQKHGICYIPFQDSTQTLILIRKEGMAYPAGLAASGLVYPLAIVARRDRVGLLHSALLSKKGRGILLAGVGGSGKSSLSVQLILQGYDYYSDEHPILSCTPKGIVGRRLWNTISLSRLAVKKFPTLMEKLVWSTRREKFLLDPRKLRPEPLGTSCRVHAIVFPRFEENSPLKMIEIPPSEVMARLMTDPFAFLTSEEGGMSRGDDRFLFGLLSEISNRLPAYSALYCNDSFPDLVKSVTAL